MAVVRKKPKMKRTQISLPLDQYEAVKRMAEERGVSLSQVFRDAIRCEAQAHGAVRDPLKNIIGMVKDGDPYGSVNHDDIIYGEDIH